MNYQEILNKFPKEVSSNTIFLGIHGSHCYGLNTETSDLDIRGIFIPEKKYYLGNLENKEQYQIQEPDGVLFSINKFFKLAMDANPNALEIIFVEPQHQLFKTKVGEKILENKELFLSKRIKFTMMGYSMAQLKDLNRNRMYLFNPPKSFPSRADLGLPEVSVIPSNQLETANAEISKELDKLQFDFISGLDDSIKIEIRENMLKILTDLKINKEEHWKSAAHKIGFSDNFIFLLQKEREYANKKRDFHAYQEWKKNRNSTRAELEAKFGYDGKNALHLVRLLKQAESVLTTGKLQVYRKEDREELLAIRNGSLTYEQLLEFADKKQKEIEVLYKNCKILPDKCDSFKLNELLVELIESHWSCS